jgi:hypothetical protein
VQEQQWCSHAKRNNPETTGSVKMRRHQRCGNGEKANTQFHAKLLANRAVVSRFIRINLLANHLVLTLQRSCAVSQCR